MNHPDPEQLLRYAEGEDVPAAVASHMVECDQCTAALADVARFETRLATSSTLPDGERAALRRVTERLLATPAAARRPRLLAKLGVAVLAAAAVLVATLLLWTSPDGLVGFDVRRYDPANVVRSERLERFALDVRVDASRWVALWQLDGKVGKRLMPHADPLLRWLGSEMPLPAGPHRVPAAEVLDFEFPSNQPPTGLVLVTFEQEPAEGTLAAIEQMIATTARDGLQAAMAAKWPEARVLPFPGR